MGYVAKRAQDGLMNCVLLVYLRPHEYTDPDTKETLRYEPGDYRVVRHMVASVLRSKGLADYVPMPKRTER